MASILSVFDIVKSKDEKGNEIEVTTEWVDSGIRYVRYPYFTSCCFEVNYGLDVSHPMPFVCSVRPRDAKAVELIKALNQGEPEL